MRYINNELISQYITMDIGIKLSGVAFRLSSDKKIEQPLRSIIKGEGSDLMGTMPIYIKEGQYKGFGLKSVLVRPQIEGNKPSHIGSILVYDELGSSSVVAVDATAITEIRTAAASAYTTHLLAREDANQLAILGTGAQAKAHLLAMQYVRPIKKVTLWGRNKDKCHDFVDWANKNINIPIAIESSPATAVRDSDIICTTTASKTPLLHWHDLPSSCHINAIGASAPGFQELNEDVYRHAKLFTDCNQSVLAASQSVIEAVKKGILPATDVGIEVGTIESNDCKKYQHGVTIFKSVGLAVQDLVFSREVIRRVMHDAQNGW